MTFHHGFLNLMNILAKKYGVSRASVVRFNLEAVNREVPQMGASSQRPTKGRPST